ncbi:MAG: O-antigen ligase domain-containing protein, partial [Chloroflexi bacterium]|nr:O-antigen ligase domain-containing protein [Chloroflexota bacterium]
EYLPAADRILLPAHNTYLLIWAELGLPGLLLVLTGLALTLTQLRRDDAAAIAAAALAAICLIMLVDFYFWGDLR